MSLKTRRFCSKFLCYLAGAVTASGGVYTSMDMLKNNRVLKAKCEEYLATI